MKYLCLVLLLLLLLVTWYDRHNKPTKINTTTIVYDDVTIVWIP
jgi:hypothetical protein